MVLNTKYKLNAHLLIKNTHCSNIWCGVQATWEKFKNGLCWSIGNGHYAHFWTNKLLPRRDRILDSVTHPIPNSMLLNPVHKYFDPRFRWC